MKHYGKMKAIFLLLALLFIFVCGTACEQQQNQKGSASLLVETKINRTELVLPIYEGYDLKVTQNNIPQEADWSSDNDCVSVSQDGTVVANEAGIATVTAIYNGQAFMCKITVVMTDTVPLLDINTGDKLILEVGDEFVLVPSLRWEGAEIAVEDVEYHSTLKIVKNKDFSATICAESKGEYTLTVTCKWHGLDLYKRMSVVVK